MPVKKKDTSKVSKTKVQKVLSCYDLVLYFKSFFIFYLKILQVYGNMDEYKSQLLSLKEIDDDEEVEKTVQSSLNNDQFKIKTLITDMEEFIKIRDVQIIKKIK